MDLDVPAISRPDVDGRALAAALGRAPQANEAAVEATVRVRQFVQPLSSRVAATRLARAN
jgi:hypothetical protein